jgi:hypothetical protein
MVTGLQEKERHQFFFIHYTPISFLKKISRNIFEALEIRAEYPGLACVQFCAVDVNKGLRGMGG